MRSLFLILFLILPIQSFAQSEYFFRCDINGEPICYASMPCSPESVCLNAMDDICSQAPYIKNSYISNEKLRELRMFFYDAPDSTILTADLVNNLCKNDKRVLK
jgi:hypothetical protein